MTAVLFSAALVPVSFGQSSASIQHILHSTAAALIYKAQLAMLTYVLHVLCLSLKRSKIIRLST
jgi:hypothetical protein